MRSLILILLCGTACADGRAILVLGSTVQKDGKPSAGLQRRLQTALELAKKDRKATIVVSGGTRGGLWPAEGPAMAGWLEQHGIDKARIRVESEAVNTAENANFSVPILEREKIDRVTIVTERFHVPRALFHLEAAAQEKGDHFVIDSVGAPDGLSASERAKRDEEERAKIERDRAFRAAHAPSRPATLGP